MTGPDHSTILHASCVALGDRAVVITGASGSGKSALALSLMGHGATLVADDRTELTRQGAVIIASAPQTIRGLIKARGVGILTADTVARAQVHLMVDLDTPETNRLPPVRQAKLLDLAIPLLHKVESPHFAPAILQYLKSGPKAEP